MLSIAAFMRGHQMLRTWIALMGASAVKYFIYSPLGYIAIDLAAAALVVARPAGLAQKAIGALFSLMVVFDLVFYLSPQANPELFYNTLIVLGWGQWAILLGWSGHDYWGRYYRWSHPDSAALGAFPRRVR